MNSALKEVTVEIQKLKAIVDNLRGISLGIPALNRSLVRISASVKMLEINFVDPGIEDS